MPESIALFLSRARILADFGRSRDRDTMVRPRYPKPAPTGATRRTAVGLILGAPLLGACAGVQQSLSSFSNPFSSDQPGPAPGPAGPPQQSEAVGNGQVKVGLLLPLSASGNAA